MICNLSGNHGQQSFPDSPFVHESVLFTFFIFVIVRRNDYSICCEKSGQVGHLIWKDHLFHRFKETEYGGENRLCHRFCHRHHFSRGFTWDTIWINRQRINIWSKLDKNSTKIDWFRKWDRPSTLIKDPQTSNRRKTQFYSSWVRGYLTVTISDRNSCFWISQRVSISSE